MKILLKIKSNIKVLSNSTLFYLAIVVLTGSICTHEKKNPAHIDEDNTASKQNKSQEDIEAEDTQPISEDRPKVEKAYDEEKANQGAQNEEKAN